MRGLEAGFCGVVVFVEKIVDCDGGGLEFFRVGEDALLGFEGFVFAGEWGGVADFACLEGPEVGEAEAVAFVLLQFCEAVTDFVPAGAGPGCGGEGGIDGGAGEAVKKDTLLGGVETGDGFGLGVDEGELGSEGAEDGDGGGLVVDVDAAFAVGEDLAAQDDFVGVDVDAVGFEDELGAGGGFEDAGEDGAVGTVTDEAGG